MNNKYDSFDQRTPFFFHSHACKSNNNNNKIQAKWDGLKFFQTYHHIHKWKHTMTQICIVSRFIFEHFCCCCFRWIGWKKIGQNKRNCFVVRTIGDLCNNCCCECVSPKLRSSSHWNLWAWTEHPMLNHSVHAVH